MGGIEMLSNITLTPLAPEEIDSTYNDRARIEFRQLDFDNYAVWTDAGESLIINRRQFEMLLPHAENVVEGSDEVFKFEINELKGEMNMRNATLKYEYNFAGVVFIEKTKGVMISPDKFAFRTDEGYVIDRIKIDKDGIVREANTETIATIHVNDEAAFKALLRKLTQ
jgi:hypothetical protein